MTTHTTTLSINIGGDVPEWEGEVTVEYSVDWAEPAQPATHDRGPTEPTDSRVRDITIIEIDGRAPYPHEAVQIADHIENNDVLLDLLLDRAIQGEM